MDKPYVLGLDLGGTNSVFGIVDTRGDIKATTAIKAMRMSAGMLMPPVWLWNRLLSRSEVLIP